MEKRDVTPYEKADRDAPETAEAPLGETAEQDEHETASAGDAPAAPNEPEARESDDPTEPETTPTEAIVRETPVVPAPERIDPNLRMTADGRILTSEDDQSED